MDPARGSGNRDYLSPYQTALVPMDVGPCPRERQSGPSQFPWTRPSNFAMLDPARGSGNRDVPLCVSARGRGVPCWTLPEGAAIGTRSAASPLNPGERCWTLPEGAAIGTVDRRSRCAASIFLDSLSRLRYKEPTERHKELPHKHSGKPHLSTERASQTGTPLGARKLF